MPYMLISRVAGSQSDARSAASTKRRAHTLIHPAVVRLPQTTDFDKLSDVPPATMSPTAMLLACFSAVLLVDLMIQHVSCADDESQVFTKVPGSRNIGLDRWREYPKGDVWLSKLVDEQPQKRAIRFGGHSDSAIQRFNKKSAYFRFNRASDDEEGFEPEDLEEAWKRSGFYRFNKRARREAESPDANEQNPDSKRSGFYRFNKKSWDEGADDEGNDKRNGFYRFNKRGYYPLDGQDVDEGNPLYR